MIFHHARAENTTFAFRSREQYLGCESLHPRVIAEPEGDEVGPRDLRSHKGIKYYARSPHIIC